MIKNTDNFGEEYSQEKPVDYKKIIFLLVRQWHWFLLFGALGFGAALIYNKLTKPQYVISASILVPEKSTGIDMKSLFEGAIDMPKNNIYNQIEIIKSYYTINQTLQNLNWRTSWSKKNMFVWNGIYKQEPYLVLETPDFVNPKGITLYITPVDKDTYIVSADGKFTRDNVITDVKFEETGTFDRPFTNAFFSFSLLKKGSTIEAPEGDYSFLFNDLNDATQFYQKKLNASLKDKKSDIISCTIEGEQKVKEGEFLNELIRVYIESKLDFQNGAQRRSLDFINSQLSGITDSLNRASEQFTNFRSQNNIIDLGAEGTLVMENIKQIESENARSQMQLDYFKNLLSYLNKPGDVKQLVSPSVVGIEDLSLNAMVLKLGELYTRRQVVSFSTKEDNPALMLIDKEIAQTRVRLNENLRNLIDNASNSISSMKERKSDMSVMLNKLPQKEQQMINIQRQLDLTNEIYTFLLQKRAETNITLASSTPDVQIIDIARPQTATIIGLSPKMILIIGFIFGLALPLGLILIINFFDDRIQTQEDVEDHTDIPILGNIMHNPDVSELAVSENPKSTLAESFRALRTNMQFMLTGSQGKVISIHSTNPGEGKSFTSVNLASILAMNNKRVLMIGADMRKPKLHKTFELANEHGLSTYLIGYDKLEQVIFPTSIPNLSVITSGPIPPNPAEIMGKPEMKDLIDRVRTMYDYIVIDNAPVSLVTDGLIASYLSDLNVFILRYGVSHKHQLEIINQFAEKQTIQHLALVVNDIKTNSFGNTYYKYYQYEAYQTSYYAVEEKGVKTRRKKKIREKRA